MTNPWMNHVRQFRKQNRHLSYRQLLQEAKKTYGGSPVGMESRSSLKHSTLGGGVVGYERPTMLTRSATRVGGSPAAMRDLARSSTAMGKKLGGKSRRRRR